MKFDKKSRLLQNEQSARAPGLGGFNFSRRIAGKYGIFRKSGRLPSLIFLRLSGLEAKDKNFGHRISISNYLKFQLDFYFDFIRQLIKTPDNYHIRKVYNFTKIKYGEYLPQTYKRPGPAAKTPEKAGIGVLSPFAYMKVDFQQRNGLTFFNNSATYQGARTHKQLSSSYPGKDDKKSSIINVKPEGSDALRKEITVSNMDYEPIPESGNAGRIFLPARSYLIIQPVRMVTYSADVTVSNLQRLAYAWVSGSQRYQTGYPFASGKQPEERHSFPAKIMNFHSAGKEAVSAKPLYLESGTAAEISYENNPREIGTGVNLLFNGSPLITRPPNMTLMDVLTTAKKESLKVSAGNEVSRENSHNEKNHLERALSRTDGHPAIKTALNQNMTETGMSHKIHPGSHLIIKPLKMVLNPLYNENQSGEPSSIKADGAGIRDMTGKSTESVRSPENFLKNRTIMNTRYENITREYEKTGYKNTIRTHRGGTILKSSEDQFPDLVFPRHGIDLKYANDTPMEIPAGEPAYNSSQELIFKKPMVQKTENIPENREQAEKTAARNRNDAFTRESFKEKPYHEINRIADTFYRMIEKRISIEKDRRGLS